ncbi:16S rRNA (cytosine(967)-C(5))-methyltransferase RsmB [Paenibacillus sp. J5C_2022]|uniref:16S rRNA (cytosine(967)-C(5))-methyltransferase RsmB n=1 Tax=Paenibacillus sp. J5C2022 TaxID=2977129 RepID=UPI0021CFE833|nr:16S rRNA (cytosine(967)-C(5))-methyltransferase RsmB [Paenibacillus sp. J5C2022]MCU6708952.1 16S rRNA (cytosine(967)-C(5))-methyltransferase RsmB [Paenibacillus sp. J5C2022]
MKRRQAARSPRELALDALVKVEQSGAYSNIQLNRMLQEAELSRADAALATELVYGTIARKKTLDYWIAGFRAKGLHGIEPWVLQLLRMSAYQLLYLERVPSHAAVNEAVDIAKRRSHRGIAGMVNGVLRNMVRRLSDLTEARIDAGEPMATVAVRHSYPEWLVRRWADVYGMETAEAICAAGNEPPHGSIRANGMLQDPSDLLQELQREGLAAEASPIAASGIIVRKGGNLVDSDGYRAGKWSMQDESSMLVAEVLSPEEGMTVLDCCAAPGGKALHIAELMKGTGKVWANDLHEHKRKLIQQGAERLRLGNVEAITGDAGALAERFPAGSMDAVLLDAPCSGFGVIRRKPEIRWTKEESDIASIAALQRRLLHAASGLVRPGGVLLYSTCTVEKEENEHQIAAFLKEHPEYALDAGWPQPLLRKLEEKGVIGAQFDGQLQLLPQHFDSDGFYIARLIRRA